MGKYDLNNFIIESFYKYIEACGETTFIAVEINTDGIILPNIFIDKSNGEFVILNISKLASKYLRIEPKNNVLTVNISLNGVVYDLTIPMNSIQCIYSFENNTTIFYRKNIF